MEGTTEDVRARRSRRGAAVVAALAVALAAACALAGPGPRDEGPPEAEGGAAAVGEALAGGSSIAEALGSEGYEAMGPEGPPPWFAEEVLAADRCQGAFAASDWSVVGLSRQEPADEAFSALVTELAGRGWRAYDSGVANAATLVKEGGEVRWMTMQCVDAGTSASVVLQLRRSSC